MSIYFDTLTYANRLKAGGFPPHLAEAQAMAQGELMGNLIDNHLATKEDIITTKEDIKNLRNEVRIEIKDLEHRLLIKLGGIMAGSTALIVGLLTILHLN